MRIALCCSVLLLLFVSAAMLDAQTANGIITGTVKDVSRAVVAGASVTVTNSGTKVSNSGKTSEIGNYTFINLIPGEYRVTVEEKGFKKLTTTALTLLVNQTLRADVTLEPGTVETAIEVTTSGVLIDTDSSTVGKVVENKQIIDLPLSNRNFMQLAVLSPGTVTDNGGSLGNEQNSFRSRLSGGGLFIGGARGGSNAYMIDGVENNDPGFQTPAISPPIDAIQEFKLMSKNYGAEFGGSAAQVNIAIKSGTNDVHGTAYEFLRNDALNDRNFFATPDPVTGLTKPLLRYNQFGYSLGGPIYIPKVVNGKNRLFFFTNYEGTRVRRYSSATGTYPTAAELSGNFSSDLIIYDPNTSAPFSGNQIPASRISAKSKQFFQYFPTPNVTPQPGFNTVKVLSGPETLDQFHTRIDARLSDRDSLFGRFSWSNQTRVSPGIAPLTGLVNGQTGHNIALSYTHVFGPRLVNEFRVGLNRPLTMRSQEGTYGADLAGQLFAGTDRAPVAFGLPLMGFTNYSSIGSTANGPLDYTTNSWSFVDSVSYTTGSHNLKVGVDYRRLFFKEVNAFQPRGNINFRGIFTAGPQNASGNSIADFVLGLPFSAAVNQGNFTGWYHSVAYNFFVQDDWKITPRLTLNWGVRYEYRQPLVEEGNRVSIFDSTYPGGRLITPDKAIVDQLNTPLIGYDPSRFLVNPDKNNWAPRIGLAYRPSADNRTVIRAGYGVFYDTFEFNEYIFPVLNPPFQKTSQLNATLQNPINFDTLFPGTATPLPVAGTMSSLTLDKGNRTPYTQQWNFNIERELGKQWAFEIGYLGSKADKLAQRSNLQQGVLTASGQVLFPYYNFGSILMDRTEGFSNYNALITRIEKRFSSGFYLLAHYTWSKSLGLTSSAAGAGNEPYNGAQYEWNWRAEYGPNSYDATHRVVVSAIYELPLGKGKQLASDVSPVVNKLIGGWQINGIYQAQTGFPFSVGALDVSGTKGSAFPRPNVVGDPYAPDPVDPSRVFNRYAFAQPAAGTFGNAGRNILRGKGLNNLDVSFFKNISIHERVNTQFRAEFFNAMNHTQFGPFPGTGFSLAPTSSFFVYRGTQQDARVVQLALKFVF